MTFTCSIVFFKYKPKFHQFEFRKNKPKTKNQTKKTHHHPHPKKKKAPKPQTNKENKQACAMSIPSNSSSLLQGFSCLHLLKAAQKQGNCVTFWIQALWRELVGRKICEKPH